MEKKVLSKDEKKILKSMFIRSHLTFLSFNMTKMEANGFTATMQPAIEDVYKDNENEKKEAYARHQNFFNTHAVPFAFIAGLSYAMEKEHKEKDSVDSKTIESIKAALMGPTAGMFDSLFFNCLRIIAAGIAIGLCSQGNFIGVPIFIFLYGITQSIAKYYCLKFGYIYGTSFIDQIFSSGLMPALRKSASVLGVMMVGCMTAGIVNVPVNWTIHMGKTSVVVGDVLNSIFPGILSIVLVLYLMRLIKKGRRPVQLIIGIFVFAFAGAFFGLF